jgi:putative Mg2+ transporter-C (MgtC) family protein
MEWIVELWEHIGYLLDKYDLFVRLLVSTVLGFIIGMDRTYRSKPAGIKTYTFVTSASALITIISIESAARYGMDLQQIRIVMDPMRLTAQIVTGLGFIGAGVILKDGLQVKGLTSAAMIFFAGGVGIGIGAGFYAIVIFGMIVTFMSSLIGNWMEKKEHLKPESVHQTR